MNILSLIPLDASQMQRLRALDPSIVLTQAPGWFDDELANTWPEATVQRYVRRLTDDGVSRSGHGTRAERDALLAKAEVVLAGFPYPLDLRSRAPRLKWFHQTPAGASNLRGSDLWDAGVVVTTSRGYGDTLAIAEYAIAGLMHFAKGFDQAGRDRAAGTFDAAAYAPVGLRDNTLCVVGAGGIGEEVARLGALLGMHVIGTRRTPSVLPADSPFERVETPQHLHAQLGQADAVVVCCQWTPETTDLLGEKAFAATKRGAVLVNVARGEIVDEAALVKALDGGVLRGAVLDVYTGEFDGPPPPALWAHEKVLITPHTSNLNDKRRHGGVAAFERNLVRFLEGHALENVVDWGLGY